jgi:hypothetical protein
MGLGALIPCLRRRRPAGSLAEPTNTGPRTPARVGVPVPEAAAGACMTYTYDTRDLARPALWQAHVTTAVYDGQGLFRYRIDPPGSTPA